jgi:hypothetical protein
MKWVAVREGSSASHGTWDYMEVADWCKNARDVEEYMDNCHMLSNWSEHYRGIEVKFVKKVPQRVLDEQIERSKAELKYHRARLKELQAMEPGKVDLREQQRKRERRKRNKMYRERGLHHLIREE